jgi:hypothetical protein
MRLLRLEGNVEFQGPRYSELSKQIVVVQDLLFVANCFHHRTSKHDFFSNTTNFSQKEKAQEKPKNSLDLAPQACM